MPELLQVDLVAPVFVLAVELHAEAPDMRCGLTDPDQVNVRAILAVESADDLLRVGVSRLSLRPAAVVVSPELASHPWNVRS